MKLICPRDNWQDPQKVDQREVDLLRFVAQRLNLVFRIDAAHDKLYLDQRRPADDIAGPGVAPMLAHARAMLGLDERRDTDDIMEVTGRSGINPATTPWCAAWAMNLLEMHRVLDLTGLTNRNYCPAIKDWARARGRWIGRGAYTPKPGDAVLFDWDRTGAQHIGLVERAAEGKLYTLEGNSDDRVAARVYPLTSAVLDGYVRI